MTTNENRIGFARAHETLMIATRMQLSHLLTSHLKSVTASVIDATRAEAAKLGLIVTPPSKRAPFQSCHHSTLDSVFSLLSMTDLFVLPLVCRHWRRAVNDSNAGVKVLSRGPLDE